MAQRKDKEKKPRQSWTPHWSLSTLYKVWMVIFTAFKIALGAAATVLLIVVICGLSFAGTLGDYLQEDVIPFADMVIENYDVDEPSYLYHLDSDGQIKVLQRVYADIESRRAEFDEIPKHLIHAAVAIEDKRFYEHQGVDWFTTVKAVVNMFFGDETVGGSSITQQLIKNVTEEDSVTVQRKVLEFFRAVNLEKKYDKDAIMTMYLNYIYMGQGCRGVKSAAATYFGKELQMLTLAECASLISITNNPSLFDPYSDDVFEFRGEMMDGMQRNQYRQRLVLDEMLSQGWITQEEYDEAIAQELVLKNGIDHADRIAKCPKECGFIGTNSQLSHSENQYYCPNCGTQILVAEDSSEGMYSWFVEAVLEDVAMDLCAKDDMPWNDTTAEMYKELIKRYPELESEEIRDRIWQYETLIDDGDLFPICDHPVLEPILQRLKHIYHGIKKPIRVFVAKDEADYLDFGAKHFPTLTLNPFSTLGASCFLNDPRQYWILVKEEMLNGEVSKEALTGLLAHEFAHLELFSTRVFHNYLVLKETKTFDVVINERLTDLYVISKGLAHALYQSRKELGESSDTFSAAEIAAFSIGLQKVE